MQNFSIIIYKTENMGVPCYTDPYFIENWLEENRVFDVSKK
jgi:hypothetical protein